MTVPATLERAQLRELDARFRRPLQGGRRVQVQFNPETLKVSFANQVTQPQGAGDQRGPATRQFVGSGTTKLALQLWFDVTAPPYALQGRIDVRELTAEVAYFITPKPPSGRAQGSGTRKKTALVPPAVRFSWGTFQFDGTLEAMEESLEFWSEDGRPLRASLGLALSQQRIQFAFDEEALAQRRAAAGTLPGAAAAGRVPLSPAPSGATVQGMAERSGRGDDWPRIAAANGIENPRLLASGQLLDLGVP